MIRVTWGMCSAGGKRKKLFLFLSSCYLLRSENPMKRLISFFQFITGARYGGTWPHNNAAVSLCNIGKAIMKNAFANTWDPSL
jgi:hypothetical protein